MDDETAEIELVCVIYDLLLQTDGRFSVTTKSEQNTTAIEADDPYEFYQHLNCRVTHLTRCP
jgi:hypothetical protein